MTINDFIIQKEPLEPETLRQIFPDLSDKEIEQIMVLHLAYVDDIIYNDLDIFENAVHVLNDIIPSIDITQGCTPEQIWYALIKLYKLRKNIKFNTEVQEYIKYIYKDAGCKFYPPYCNLENTLRLKLETDSKNIIFPLKETADNVQLAKYLYIQEYIRSKK